MIVYNRTSGPIHYRGQVIPANSGIDYSDLEIVPDRDRKLEKAKILSFGVAPQWNAPVDVPKKVATEEVVDVEKVLVVSENFKKQKKIS